MKTNRAECIGMVAIMLLTIFFWVLVVCGIVGDTICVAPWAIICYVACAVYIVNVTLNKGRTLRKLLLFLIIVIMQLIPYIIILAIKGLL